MGNLQDSVGGLGQTFKDSSCCCRTGSDAMRGPPSAPPPPELCGYYFQNSLAVEYKLGTVDARRKHGIPAPSAEEGEVAWAIVDNRGRSLEFHVGSIADEHLATKQLIKGKVYQWGKESWLVFGQDPVAVGECETVEQEGQQVVTSIKVNGITLHRVFAAVVNDVPVQVIINEAKQLGWEAQCMQACLAEINRMIAERKISAQRRSSRRSSLGLNKLATPRPDESIALSEAPTSASSAMRPDESIALSEARTRASSAMRPVVSIPFSEAPTGTTSEAVPAV